MDLHKLKVYDDPILDRQMEELFRMLAKPSGAGVPTIGPRYPGDEYLDSTANQWYKAVSLTTWAPIGSVGEAPNDGKIYVRRNGAWEELVIS
jgi:hypothetical protein